MRRHRLSKQPEEDAMLGEGHNRVRNKKKIKQKSIAGTIATVDGTGIKYHTFSDIGRYTVFPAQTRKRLFPSGAYGRI